jgi:hypothetical protein
MSTEKQGKDAQIRDKEEFIKSDYRFFSQYGIILSMMEFTETDSEDLSETSAAIISSASVLARLLCLIIDDIRGAREDVQFVSRSISILENRLAQELETTRRQAAAIQHRWNGDPTPATENALIEMIAGIHERLDRIEREK